jgi:hypothetical protein
MFKNEFCGVLSSSQSQKIRDSYEKSVFPSRFSSWLTGKPNSKNNEKSMLNWLTYTILVTSAFALGLFAVLFGENLLVQVVGGLMVFAASRRFAAVIVHQAVHHRLTGVEVLDMLIGEFCSILSFSQDFKSYQHDHCVLHHSPNTFATPEDPILIFLERCGLRHGMRKSELILGMWSCALSPVFHLKFIAKRVKHNLDVRRPVRALLAVTYLSALGYMFYTSSNISGAVVLFVSIIILYQVSAFIEICSEHLWFGNTSERRNTPYFYADISWGRFCGLQYPSAKGNVFVWYLINIFYHLPTRLFILVGDLPQHDFHHRHPLVENWVDARALRNKAIQNLDDDEPQYIEIWGIHNAISIVFEQLSQSEPANPELYCVEKIEGAHD